MSMQLWEWAGVAVNMLQFVLAFDGEEKQEGDQTKLTTPSDFFLEVLK